MLNLLGEYVQNVLFVQINFQRAYIRKDRDLNFHQSIYKMDRHWFSQFDVIIGDEAHHIDLSSDGWVSVNDILIEEGHAYDYHGGKKKDFKNEIKEEKVKAEQSIKEV